jgi:hypothetical protein
MPILIGAAVAGSIGLAGMAGVGATQLGIGAYKAHKGKKDSAAAMDELKSTHYANYNQAYFDELQKRATMGMPEEQKRYAEMNADRAAGYGAQVRDDRRAGLMGIGNATTSLADTYKQIANTDAQYKYQNQQQLLGEISNRGNMAYQEKMNVGNMNLALARSNRQEGMGLINAGLQTGANAFGNTMALATGFMGMPQSPSGFTEEQTEK